MRIVQGCASTARQARKETSCKQYETPRRRCGPRQVRPRSRKTRRLLRRESFSVTARAHTLLLTSPPPPPPPDVARRRRTPPPFDTYIYIYHTDTHRWGATSSYKVGEARGSAPSGGGVSVWPPPSRPRRHQADSPKVEARYYTWPLNGT